MLSLSKKVDYALIALAHLAERAGRVSSAREIAVAYDLPLPLLMNILKELNQSGWVRSSRGTKGGYEIGVDPKAVSLHDLILLIEGPVQTTECAPTEKVKSIVQSCSCDDDRPADEFHQDSTSENAESCGCRLSRLCPVQAPLKALNDRLVRFLSDVKLADIISYGPKVDVPLEMMGIEHAHSYWEGEAPAEPKPSRKSRLPRNFV